MKGGHLTHRGCRMNENFVDSQVAMYLRVGNATKWLRETCVEAPKCAYWARPEYLAQHERSFKQTIANPRALDSCRIDEKLVEQPILRPH